MVNKIVFQVNTHILCLTALNEMLCLKKVLLRKPTKRFTLKVIDYGSRVRHV